MRFPLNVTSHHKIVDQYRPIPACVYLRICCLFQTWFQNKRSRTRRMMGQPPRDASPPSATAPADLEKSRPTPRLRLSPPAPRTSPEPPTGRAMTREPSVTLPAVERRKAEDGGCLGYRVVKPSQFTTTDDMVIDFSVR